MAKTIVTAVMSGSAYNMYFNLYKKTLLAPLANIFHGMTTLKMLPPPLETLCNRSSPLDYSPGWDEFHQLYQNTGDPISH